VKKIPVVVLGAILVTLLVVGSVVKFAGPILVSSLSNYKTYTFKQPAITISLPEGTTVTDKFQGKNEVLFSTYLRDPKLNLRGYLQVWELGNLEAFLAASKQTSTLNYTSYTVRPIQIQRYKGYLVEWSATFSRYYSISAKEFWLKKDTGPQVLRLSFFTDQAQFPKPLEQVVNTIVASLKW
jgi:hypothetical protein